MSWKRLSREKQDAFIQKAMLRPLPEGDFIEPDEVVPEDEVVSDDEVVLDDVDIDEEIDPDEPVRQ